MKGQWGWGWGWGTRMAGWSLVQESLEWLAKSKPYFVEIGRLKFFQQRNANTLDYFFLAKHLE